MVFTVIQLVIEFTRLSALFTWLVVIGATSRIVTAIRATCPAHISSSTCSTKPTTVATAITTIHSPRKRRQQPTTTLICPLPNLCNDRQLLLKVANSGLVVESLSPIRVQEVLINFLAQKLRLYFSSPNLKTQWVKTCPCFCICYNITT